MPRTKLTERAITKIKAPGGGQHKERQMRTITILGRPSATIVDLTEPTGVRPATGKYAELLGDITHATNALLRLVEAERSGVCDGQGSWIGSDPLLGTARKLAALVEQRVGVPRR